MPDTLPSVPSPPLQGLEPVLAPGIRTLLLCSYPGKDSLAKGEYYAGGQNQFWALMSAVLDEALSEKTYEEKLMTLLSCGIGLWDVVSACQSKGSLKTALQENRPERFAVLQKNCPLLCRIAFNGQPAGEYAPLFEQAGYATLLLPSSSPAYSKQPFEKKLESWRHLL